MFLHKFTKQILIIEETQLDSRAFAHHTRQLCYVFFFFFFFYLTRSQEKRVAALHWLPKVLLPYFLALASLFLLPTFLISICNLLETNYKFPFD